MSNLKISYNYRVKNYNKILYYKWGKFAEAKHFDRNLAEANLADQNLAEANLSEANLAEQKVLENVAHLGRIV